MATIRERATRGADSDSEEEPPAPPPESEDEDVYLEDTSGSPEVMKRFFPKEFHLDFGALVMVALYFFVWVIVAYLRPHLGVCMAVLHVSFLPFFVWWLKTRHFVNLQLCIYYYAAGFGPGSILVYFAQYILSMILFGIYTSLDVYNWIEREKQGAWHSADWIILAIASWVCFAIPEELIKARLLKGYVLNRNKRFHTKKHIILLSGLVLGFCNGQALIITAMVHIVGNYFDGIHLSTLLLAVIATPLHLLMSATTAVKIHTAGSSSVAMVAFNILFRGFVVFQTFLFILVDGVNRELSFLVGAVAVVAYYYYFKSVYHAVHPRVRAQIAYSKLPATAND